MSFKCYLFYLSFSNNLSRDPIYCKKEITKLSAKKTAWGLPQILCFIWATKLVVRVFEQ